MKVLLLSVLAIFVLAVQAEGNDCEPYCNACKNDYDIAQISCGGKGTCHIAPGDGLTAEDVDYLLEPAITEITADGCRKKCKQQRDHIPVPTIPEKLCKFFHWQEVHEEGQTDKVTTCSLQTSCTEPSGYCETFDCVSGQLGCDEECQTSLPCSLTKTEWVHGNFHVICTDTTQEDGDGDVDIYSDDIVIPDGTICNTIRKCSDWDQAEPGATYYRKLAVFCDGSADPATWKPMEGTGKEELSNAMIEEQGTIKEQACAAACEPLTIPKLQDWADLVCDIPLGEGDALEDGNSCILLCDNHLRMTIDCKYRVEGDKKWQDAHGDLLTAAKIKC